MSRVPKAATAPEATPNLPVAPAATGALANLDLSKAFSADPSTQRSQWLPNLKIAYPIEVGKRGVSGEHIYKMGLSDGNTFELVPAPFLVVALANRNAARRTVEGEKGKVYEMAFGECMGMGNSQAKYHQMAKDAVDDPSVHLGVRWLVAVFRADGSVALANVDAFDASKEYFGVPLTQAVFNQKRGVEFKCMEHSGNLTASKHDKSRMYLDPRKHTQWAAVELTQDRLSAILGAWDANKDKIESWLKS
jgi:hypothetical protein